VHNVIFRPFQGLVSDLLCKIFVRFLWCNVVFFKDTFHVFLPMMSSLILGFLFFITEVWAFCFYAAKPMIRLLMSLQCITWRNALLLAIARLKSNLLWCYIYRLKVWVRYHKWKSIKLFQRTLIQLERFLLA